MTQIYVDYPKLQNAATSFGRHHETLLTTLSELAAGLAPMISSWEGSAQAMYLEKKAAWDNAAADLAALLRVIQEQTAQAHDGYAKTVQANVSLWT